MKIALRALLSNKARTSLTILGMVIGIASVVIVYSAGAGIQSLILGQIESFGTDIVDTETKVPSAKKGAEADQQSAMAMATGVQVTTLKIKDLEDVKKIANIKNGYGVVTGQELIGYGNEQHKANIFGVSPSYIDIDKSEIDYGQFFSESEDKSLSQVVVLGKKMKEKLFGDSDPIGKSISIRNKKFTVIGIMKERGAMGTLDFDDIVYLPVRTLQKRIMGIDHILYMVHQLKDLNIADETAEEIRQVMRENHDITDPVKDDFRVTTMQESLKILDTVTGAITLLLLAIVAISLVVGGVGIMNVMYVVVTERTSEIGLRKAIGAKYKDIMWQFLAEAVMITSLAGVIGIAIGILMSLLIAWGATSYGLEWKFSVPVQAYIVSLSFSTFFGVAFGLYPARKAARLDPIEALRTE